MRFVLTAMSLLFLCACATPVVKSKAFHPGVLGQHPLPADLLKEDPRIKERKISVEPTWLSDVDPNRALTFVGYRTAPQSMRFCVVLECSPRSDRLVLQPLEPDESPVQVLADSRRQEEFRRMVGKYASGDYDGPANQDRIYLSLQRAIRENRLGPPLPPPRHIFAVAVNYPSHLTNDLAIDNVNSSRQHLAASRPRVFLKYPQLLSSGDFQRDPRCIRGPFDGIQYNRFIEVPDSKSTSTTRRVQTRLDYEVEIGVVVGRRLTWDAVQTMDDADLSAAICAYVLVSDAKARNPQVVRKMIRNMTKAPRKAWPYRVSDSSLNDALGAWDSETCRWWSYAASLGTCASVGPFLVAAPADGTFASRALVCGRTYARRNERSFPPPAKRAPDTFYLRQCSRTTYDPDDPDRMIWSVPQIMRSILAPDSVLRFGEQPVALEAGDVICLGTPGGVVITSSPEPLVDFLDFLLFWLDPIDWHNLVFKRNAGLYLHQGDTLFLWAEGLGFQRQSIQRIDRKE